jgi:hypothetical protein
MRGTIKGLRERGQSLIANRYSLIHHRYHEPRITNQETRSRDPVEQIRDAAVMRDP